MKTKLTAAACFAILFPLAACADADANAVAQGGKSRSEVRAELVRAERQGSMATVKERAYPREPEQIGPETIKPMSLRGPVCDAGVRS